MGSVPGLDGVVWYTLVVEDRDRYFVTRHDESRALRFGKNSEIIDPADFDRHNVNNVPLSQLVAEVSEVFDLDLAITAMLPPDHWGIWPASVQPPPPPPPPPA